MKVPALALLALMLGGLAAGAPRGPARVAGLPPNVVIILTDDQRWDSVDATHGLNGQPVMPIVTAELVNSGVTFTQAAVTTALCCPSRASILTGQYAHNHGVWRNMMPNGGALAFEDDVTLATLLQGAGYRTGLVGKYLNHYNLLDGGLYVPPGWDDWRVFRQPWYYDYDLNENGALTHFGSAPADYSTDVLAAKAVSFIASSQQPFFLMFTPFAPHSPSTPAPRHVGSYASLPDFHPPNYNEKDVTDKAPWLQAQPFLTAKQRAALDQERIDQLESLQAEDEAVGAIMQALRDKGVDSNTLVIFMGDNGYSWGEHRLIGKECPYEECMRVPMVMRYPPLVSAPRQDPNLVLNIDLLPTILELAGVQAPAGTNGVSMTGLLAGNSAGWRTDFLNEHWPSGGTPIPRNSLVRTEQYKYIEYPLAGGQGSELYDLIADPYELVNRTNDPALAQVKAGLVARLAILKAE